MPFFEYDSTSHRKFHYQLHGTTGSQLVLIHSSMSSHREWVAQQSLADKVKLALIDLPGHGDSDLFLEPVTVSAFTEIVSKFIKVLNLEPAVVVGHSIGGAVAMQLALDFPLVVQALVLIGTGAKLGVYPAILEGLRIDYDRAIDLTIGDLSFGKDADPLLVEQTKREAKACPQQVSLADFQACNAFDIRERLHEIQVPTLIIVGEEDKLTPVKWARYLHEHITDSQLEVIPGGGHFIMQEQPEAVNQAIFAFVASQNLK
jgi:pimeloyl-ACP methyl ester carboxylesterase